MVQLADILYINSTSETLHCSVVIILCAHAATQPEGLRKYIEHGVAS